MKWIAIFSLLLGGAVSLAGCGGTTRTAGNASTTHLTTPAATPVTTTTGGPGALQAEANAAVAGDIPDNQQFLVFQDARGGYSMKYPEGWAQQGADKLVVFRDKNNIVRIAVDGGPTFTAATIKRALKQLAGARIVSGPQAVQLANGPAYKVTYSTRSAPNAVTGKRLTLLVDRYYLTHGGRRAVVDLGTPQGVDNVDAYRLMIESFRWR
jgi:hypothetical protein